MAEAKLPREPDQGFVGRLVQDPAAPPELRLLAGYPGASSAEGHRRLYASPDLSSWWEIPEDAILHRQAVQGDPLGAEILWVRRDQQPVLNQGRSEAMYTTFPPTYICPTGPVLPPTWGYGCGPGPVQPPTQFCTTTPVGAAAVYPTQICTIPPPTIGCHQQAYSQYCGTTPVGAAAVQPTQICSVPPPSVGCHQQAVAPTHYCTVLPPTSTQCFTHDVNCGTSPVGGAQAQAQQTVQPTTHFTIPPQTMCCPAQTVQPTTHISIPPQTMCCPAR